MSYLLRRILGVIPILFFSWTVVFVVLQLIPGDPVDLMLVGRPASQEVRDNVRIQLGLDKPPLVRYGTFLLRAVQGDLGYSYRTRQPVANSILQQVPETLSSPSEVSLLDCSLGFCSG